MRRLNLILFSSGVSEANGTLDIIKRKLQMKGYNCFCWRELFLGANDANNIALLPMLIKKIPTFDFAVMICEGHDKTSMVRNGETITVNSMRDNVLFEIGMCSMALGLSKVILVTDCDTHLPDDLIGIDGKIALKRMVISKGFSNNDLNNSTENDDRGYNIDFIINNISEYIDLNRTTTSPAVIGAATATAEGYATNFILRTMEHICNGFRDKDDPDKGLIKYPIENIFFKIVIPEEYDSNSPVKAKKTLSLLNTGTIDSARSRIVEFKYKEVDSHLYIIDYPTTLVTSYDTARLILKLNADDSADSMAEERFTAKELDLFESTLRNIMNESFVRQKAEHFYSDLDISTKENMIEALTGFFQTNFSIERNNY